MSVAAVVLWLVLGLVSVGVWWPAPVRWTAASRARLVVTLAGTPAGTGAVALLGALGTGAGPPLSWFVVAAGVLSAVASGNVVTRAVLALAVGATAPARRVRATVLRGGAWIGVLERLGSSPRCWPALPWASPPWSW